MKKIIYSLLVLAMSATMGCSDGGGGGKKGKKDDKNKTPVKQTQTDENNPIKETDITEDQALKEVGVTGQVKAVYTKDEVASDLKAFQKTLDELVNIGYSVRVDDSLGCDDCEPGEEPVLLSWDEAIFDEYLDKAESPPKTAKVRSQLIKVRATSKALLHKYGAGFRINGNDKKVNYLKIRELGQLLVFQDLATETLRLKQKDHFEKEDIVKTTVDQVQFITANEAVPSCNGRDYSFY